MITHELVFTRGASVSFKSITTRCDAARRKGHPARPAHIKHTRLIEAARRAPIGAPPSFRSPETNDRSTLSIHSAVWWRRLDGVESGGASERPGERAKPCMHEYERVGRPRAPGWIRGKTLRFEVERGARRRTDGDACRRLPDARGDARVQVQRIPCAARATWRTAPAITVESSPSLHDDSSDVAMPCRTQSSPSYYRAMAYPRLACCSYSTRVAPPLLRGTGGRPGLYASLPPRS